MIEKRTIIGTCEEIAWIRRCQDQPSSSNNKHVKCDVSTLLDECRKNLTEEELGKAQKTLVRFANIFSTGDADIGKTGLVQHTINCTNLQRRRIISIGTRVVVSQLSHFRN